MRVGASTKTAREERSIVGDELRVEILSAADVVQVRQRGREFAASAGFSSGDQTVIAVAISEIARNIISYAKRGEVTLQLVTNGERQGVRVVAHDRGPGIEDLTQALQDGFSTSGAWVSA